MTTEQQRQGIALHVFFNEDGEEFWVAHDMGDLRAQQLELVDEDDWHPEDWSELDDAATKAILFTGEPDAGLTNMASEDDNPHACVEVTKTFAEWAALNGRGYFGGGRS